jgi:hypothetical protein
MFGDIFGDSKKSKKIGRKIICWTPYSWAAEDGQVTKGRHPQKWTSFLDCLELHKLTVFIADAAKRQQFYIQQEVRKPQRATVQQHISHMGVLNDYVKHLPTLKDSSKAVPTTKKGNIPFGEADLAAIVLLSVPMLWQNQYNLNHSTVLESKAHDKAITESYEQLRNLLSGKAQSQWDCVYRKIH